MFQVSDEIGYFTLAQQVAAAKVAGDPGTLARVMPDGGPFYNSPGGKPLFGEVAGTLLARAARSHASPDAAMLVRLAIAVCHVLVVVATWAAARRLYPAHVEIAFIAASLASWHPVLASFQAGITPDAFANASSASALYLVTVAVTTRRAWLPLVGATLLAAVAFAFKDTALCVFASVGVAATMTLWRPRTGRGGAVVAIVVVVAGAVGATLLVRSPYLDPVLAGLDRSRVDTSIAWRLLATIARDVVPAFQSFWASFGNFGAHEIPFTSAWPLAIGVLCGLAAAGAVFRPFDTVMPAPRPAWWSLWAGIVAGLMLHPLRIVVLHGVDAFQGRWLFPMIVPLMIALAVGLRHALATARAAAAIGGLASAAIGVLPLVLIVVPFFYETFPGMYATSNLYLQGVYGQGAEPGRAMAFVAPVSGWLVQARGLSVVLVAIGGAVTVAIGLRWPDATVAPAADRDVSAHATTQA